MSRYDPVPPFEWPKPGQRTWVAPELSYFPPCTGKPECTGATACPVKVVVTVDGGAYGCDCPCHAAEDQRAPNRSATDGQQSGRE